MSTHQTADPPVTPHANKSAPQKSIEVTPLNAGSASHVSYDTQTTQEHYKPYLAVDIANAKTIPFETFLDIAFSPLDWRSKSSEFETITTSSHFKKLLEEYYTESGHETRLYHRFNTLTNHIIEEVSNKPSLHSLEELLVICRNDHVVIKGSDAHRIPDCVIVSKKVSELPERFGWENMSDAGPVDAQFHWSELLAFVEFKVGERAKAASKPVRRKKVKRKASTTLKVLRAKQSSASSTSSISMTHSPAVASAPSTYSTSTNTSSGPHSIVANTSSGPYSTAANTSSGPPSIAPTTSSSPSPSYVSGSRRSTSSQKRSGDNLESSVKKQLKGKQAEDENKDKELPLTRRDVLIQCASYALEMLSDGGLRTHVLSALVTGCEIELLYYDRSMPVLSEAVDFHEEPSRLVTLMYCMQHSTASQWGRVARITLGPNPLSENESKPTPKRFSARLSHSQSAPDTALAQVKPHPLRGALLTLTILGRKVVLEVGDLLFLQHALIGRGTLVVRARVIGYCPEQWKNQSIIVKFSFAPVTRTREGDILDRILDIARKPEHEWVVNNLPTVLHYETVKLDAKDDTQSRLSDYFKSEKIPYEDRVLQILVMTELFPIRELKTSQELLPVIRDVFKCYKWLHTHAKVIHRDISLNNLMYRKEVNEDGSIRSIHGVLSDYDLSVFFDEEKLKQTSMQRTGTQPYMAIDLLQPTPPPHLYRHDLESLFYVIVVLTSRYHEGKEIKDPPLQAWFELGPRELLVAKINALTSVYADPKYAIPKPTPSFSTMVPLILKMQNLFRRGFAAKGDHEWALKERSIGTLNEPLAEYDHKTLGGHVNFEQFERLLDLSTNDSARE